MIDILLQAVRGAEVIAGWLILFYLYKKPPTQARRIVLLMSLVGGYIFWYLIPFDVWLDGEQSRGFFLSAAVANELLWIALLVIFALLCGDLRNSLFAVCYYVGIEQCIDIIRYFTNIIINHGEYVRGYAQYVWQYLIMLILAYFYYRLRRKCPGNPPLAFQILTVLTPIITTILITQYSEIAGLSDTNSEFVIKIYRNGLFVCFALLGFNIIMFYLYIRLLIAYEVKSVIVDVAAPPPFWTKTGGLSGKFLAAYKISPREASVINTLLEGKTYAEIGNALNISVKTVETHLRNIYKKTNTSSRFALFTLIKGE